MRPNEAVSRFVGYPIRAGDNAGNALIQSVGKYLLRVTELPAKEVQPDVVVLNGFDDNSLPDYSIAVQNEMTENRLHRQWNSMLIEIFFFLKTAIANGTKITILNTLLNGSHR